VEHNQVAYRCRKLRQRVPWLLDDLVLLLPADYAVYLSGRGIEAQGGARTGGDDFTQRSNRCDQWDNSLAVWGAFVFRARGGLGIIDVSDPAHPQRAGFVEVPRGACGVAATVGANRPVNWAEHIC